MSKHKQSQLISINNYRAKVGVYTPNHQPTKRQLLAFCRASAQSKAEDALANFIKQVDAFASAFFFAKLEKKQPILKKFIDFILNCKDDIDLSKGTCITVDIMVKTILLSKNEDCKASRKEVIGKCRKLNLFHNEDVFFVYFSLGLNSKCPNTFRDILDHRFDYSNVILKKMKRYVLGMPESRLENMDIFFKLNPSSVKNKNWGHLTLYDKLYFIFHEENLILNLSHRLALRGSFQPVWKGGDYKSLSGLFTNDERYRAEFDLEGHYAGWGYLQLKESVLMFGAQYQCQKAFSLLIQETIDEIATAVVRKSYLKHQWGTNENRIFIHDFKDEHMTSSYVSKEGNVYLINMGHKSGIWPGIKRYKVREQDQTKIIEMLDKTGENKDLTEVFKGVCSRYGYAATRYYFLPYQQAGNCSYESSRGLFFAILIDKFTKQYGEKLGYKRALRVYLNFLQFDYKEALDNYKIHALSPSKELVFRAEQQIEFLSEEILPKKRYYTINLRKI